MGRWAQARKRGSVVGSAAGFPLSPPLTGDDFVVAGSAVQLNAFGQDVCPPGADGLEYRYRVQGDPDFIADGVGPCDDQTEVLNPCDLGLPYDVQARWVLGGTPVSDWSASFEVDCDL
jgi:hypothetical protein